MYHVHAVPMDARRGHLIPAVVSYLLMLEAESGSSAREVSTLTAEPPLQPPRKMLWEHSHAQLFTMVLVCYAVCAECLQETNSMRSLQNVKHLLSSPV